MIKEIMFKMVTDFLRIIYYKKYILKRSRIFLWNMSLTCTNWGNTGSIIFFELWIVVAFLILNGGTIGYIILLVTT